MQSEMITEQIETPINAEATPVQYCGVNCTAGVVSPMINGAAMPATAPRAPSTGAMAAIEPPAPAAHRTAAAPVRPH